MSKSLENLFIVFALIFIFSAEVMAHQGTVYPILKNLKIDNNTLSIWVDPDLHQGTFSLFLDGENNSRYTIELSASPRDNPRYQLKTIAEINKLDLERSTYKAVIPFDKTIMWNVEFTLKLDGMTRKSLILPVEVRDLGPNRWEFALYFLPFVLVGFIFMKLLMAKRLKSPSISVK